MTIYLLQQSLRDDIVDVVRQRPKHKWVWASLQYAVPTTTHYAYRDKAEAIAECRMYNRRKSHYVVYLTPVALF